MKRKMFLILPLIMAAIHWSGCENHSQAENDWLPKSQVFSQIEQGKTTKAGVRSLLGEPDYVTLTDTDKELWTYYYMKSGVAMEPRYVKVGGVYERVAAPKSVSFIWDLKNEEAIENTLYVDYHIFTIVYSKENLVEGLLTTTRISGESEEAAQEAIIR